MSEPVQCPHCKGDLSFEAVSDLAPESRMSFSVTPAPGEKVSPDTFGGTLVKLTKFLNAVGKDIGVPTAVLLEKVETKEDGSHVAHLLVARYGGAAEILAWKKAAKAKRGTP